MATQHSRTLARFMISPSIILLFIWMIVPLALTIYFSFLNFNLLNPGPHTFAGFSNYYYFVTNPAFWASIGNTLILVFGVLAITIVGGILLALLLDMPMWGQGIVRILIIAPFFVMPTVSALIWKNMFMNPVNGIFAWIFHILGIQPFDFITKMPLFSIICIVSWEYLPFAILILLTALQSLDSEQIEAAEMDGANGLQRFIYIVLPHLIRSITIVILILSIFLLSIFAEIYVTTNGGPGTASTNLPYLIYEQSLLQFDVGGGSAGGIIAVILANIVAIFMMMMIGKNLEA